MTGNKKEKIRVQDIAKALNISSSTVSRALNDHPRISKKTKDKVRQLAMRMGYYTGFPKLMNPEKTEAVVVLTPSLENEIYRDVISGITDFFLENNFQTFVLNTQNNIEQTSAFLSTYKKYGISGIIHIISERAIPNDFYTAAINDAMPLVTVFEPDMDLDVSSVQPDMYDGIFKALKYLKLKGIGNVSLLLEHDNKPEDYLIVSSFKTVLESLGMNTDNCPVHYLGIENMAVENVVRPLLTDASKQQAIIVKGVISALEIMTICRNTGLEIPNDLILIAIGTDNCPAALINNLSLIKLPTYEMGREAAEILMRQIKQPDQGKTVEIKPVSFILKGSAIRME